MSTHQFSNWRLVECVGRSYSEASPIVIGEGLNQDLVYLRVLTAVGVMNGSRAESPIMAGSLTT
jgi:hypothetical protein